MSEMWDRQNQGRSPEPTVALPQVRRARPTIGLLTAWLRDPYATVTWSGVLDVARQRDVNVINLVGSRLNSPIDAEAPAEVLFDLLDAQRLDGLVVFSEMLYHFTNAQEMKHFLERYRPLPMTSIGILPGIPSVMLDIKKGMRDMVAHLIEVHGYRRLAFLSGPAGEETAEALYRGYREALNEFNLPFDPRLVTPPVDRWGAALGTQGVRVLLDERQLRPGVDFEAIAGCADYEILAAIYALQERGFRVPYDVAVTGFNNLEVTRYVTPSLTTVDRRIIELARRATEMLLDLLDGQPVPEQVLLAPEVVVRRSCGCVPQTVIQAAVAAQARSARPIAWLQAEQRALLLAAVEEVGRTHRLGGSADVDQSWPVQLVDALLDELEGHAAGLFLATLEDILNRVVAAGGEVAAWQSVISTLRQQLTPWLGEQRGAQAENLWHQARVLIADFTEKVPGQQKLEAARQVETLSDITQSLITTFDINGLMDLLARDLPQLGIPSGYLSLYEDPSSPTEWCQLLLAYDESGRIELEPGGRRFPSRQLVPAELLPSHRRYSLVVLPLFFRGEQLGLLALEMGPREGNVYEALRGQISSALKGAMLATRNVDLYNEALRAWQVAEEANRLKSRFLSMVSHELRTPLSLIVGTIELMLRQEAEDKMPLPEIYRRDISCIRASAQHLFRLIGDVLDLASSQAGELRLNCEVLDLRHILQEVAMLGESMAREKGLGWQAHFASWLPPVWGDRTRLRQVTLNLISNAVKFTERGEVRLEVEATDGGVTVSVHDTGVGIPPEEQASIFNEFRRSEHTTRRGYSGMGLGLAITRRLVELHGGQIGVSSTGKEGAGSTFYFTLPAYDGPSPAAECSTSLGHNTVLLLAERALAGERLARHLTQRGFAVEVLGVEEHPDWLTRALSLSPGAVVLDFQPATERGWELMRLLKENATTRDIPVVFYSLSQDEDSGSVLQLDYLTKPVDGEDLVSALERQGLRRDDCQAGRGILVVDDDPCVLEMHTRMVRSYLPDCRILQARHGRQALEVMDKERPDLVLLDLMMPEMDGFRVLEVMRDRPHTRNVPVIVLTAQTLTSEDMVRLQQGVAAVLAKGMFRTDEVLAQVEAALARTKRLGGETQRIVRQVMAYLHEHYAEPVTRAQLARRFGLSERHLDRCFRLESGLAPLAYLNRYRVRQARTLLEQGNRSITQVALAVGFSDSNYFSRVFRQEVGMSPREYLRQAGELPH